MKNDVTLLLLRHEDDCKNRAYCKITMTVCKISVCRTWLLQYNATAATLNLSRTIAMDLLEWHISGSFEHKLRESKNLMLYLLFIFFFFEDNTIISWSSFSFFFSSVSISLYVCVCLSGSWYVCVCLSFFLCLYIGVYVCLSFSFSFPLSFCLHFLSFFPTSFPSLPHSSSSLLPAFHLSVSSSLSFSYLTFLMFSSPPSSSSDLVLEWERQTDRCTEVYRWIIW